MKKKEFVAVSVDLEHKVFIMHVTAFSVNSDDKIYLLKKAAIAYLKAAKASIKVFKKYADFAYVFSPKLAIKLSQHMEINNYTIK